VLSTSSMKTRRERSAIVSVASYGAGADDG
jgi:hypothetical protein